jgi:hypothetical protein
MPVRAGKLPVRPLSDPPVVFTKKPSYVQLAGVAEPRDANARGAPRLVPLTTCPSTRAGAFFVAGSKCSHPARGTICLAAALMDWYQPRGDLPPHCSWQQSPALLRGALPFTRRVEFDPCVITNTSAKDAVFIGYLEPRPRGDFHMSDSPEVNVTTLALLNLIRLLAAELVAGQHRHDVEQVVAAIDRKLDSTPLPRGINVNDARTGITRARDLLRPYVAQLRKQARTARVSV